MRNPYAMMLGDNPETASQKIIARDLLKDEIASLIAAETEACAKIAETLAAERRRLEEARGFGPESAKPIANQFWCEEIAAAIRARKGSPA